MTDQPNTRTVTEPGFEAVEIIDMGDHLILLQRDEAGEANSVVIGPETIELIRKGRPIQ